MQTILGNRRIPQKVRPAAGRRRRAQNQTPERTSRAGGHGFLNYRFAPVTEDKDGILKNKTRMEREFLQSLQHLCSLYQIPVPSLKSQPFPLNILTAYREVQQHFATLAGGLELVVIETNHQTASLATVQTYNTGTTLYYIPVRPLADLLTDPARQQEAELLLYVYAYLYHVVDIPWFLNTGSFLDYTYEMMESSYMDSLEPGEEEATLEKLTIFDRMRSDSDALQKKLHLIRKLRGWSKCLRVFNPSSPAGQPLKKVAQSAWELYKAYPGRSIWNSIEPDLLHPEYDERIRADYYISFFWDSEDDLYDDLMETINSCLQEYGVADEPVNVQIFDQPQAAVTHSLDFEQKLFTLIDDLCTVLNELV